MSHSDSLDLILQPEDNERLANLCGQLDQHLRLIENRLGVSIANRGSRFQLKGAPSTINAACELIKALYDQTEVEVLNAEAVHLALQESGLEMVANKSAPEAIVRTRRSQIRARGPNQAGYIEGIRNNDLTFGVGPAGTGKTYLAVACAVEALESDRVRRLVLVRPAVEAGERLGFLPGDLAQKVDPYLRPMYDALYEMLGFDKVARLMERNVIEVAPLAYMRGRTLNEAFIVMDEAQNTTVEQMKMFLTRIGFGSTAVVTGDMTQIDLPNKVSSGLRHALHILKEVDGIHTTQFIAKDVVRHPLVRRIVDAYAAAEENQ
ncbi:PhoH family protein [gamma proteobacterium HTCC5015]|nr:PhoH family protein [gamma proteobacterium HTCC5015]